MIDRTSIHNIRPAGTKVYRSACRNVVDFSIRYDHHEIQDAPEKLKTIIRTYLIFMQDTDNTKKAFFGALDTMDIRSINDQKIWRHKVKMLENQAEQVAKFVGGRVEKNEDNISAAYPDDYEVSFSIIRPLGTPDVVRINSPAIFRVSSDDRCRSSIIFAKVDSSRLESSEKEELDDYIKIMIERAEKEASMLGGIVEYKREELSCGKSWDPDCEHTIRIILPQKPQL